MTDFKPSRRGFLSAAVLLGGAAGTGLLSGCGGGGATSSSGANTKVILPSYIPSSLVEADLPGKGAAIQPGFFNYPLGDLKKTVEKAPGNGSSLSFLTLTFGAVGTQKAENKYWQFMNKELNADLDVQTTLADSYLQKVQTVIAGGQVPNMVTFGINYPIPQTPALLKSKFTDITSHVSGDAIKDYPNLANIPTEAWQATVFNGGIYGVPCPRPTGGAPILAYTDSFDAAGITSEPGSLEELREALKTVTDPGKSLWGVSNPFSAAYYGRLGNGSPNNWREDGGKFTHEIETEEFEAALAWAQQVKQDGSIHPDGITVEDGNRLFAARNVATTLGSATGWPGVYAAAVKAGAKIAPWVAPAAAGKKAVLHAGSPYGFFTAFAKTEDAERIKEMLRIANYIAAPFGSQEHLNVTYGVKDLHWADKNGVITPTDLAKTEKGISFSYLSNAPLPQFNPGFEDGTKLIHDFQAKTEPMLSKDPTQVLFSDTWSNKKAQLNTLVTTAINDVVLGRKPVSAIKSEVVPAWKAAGGDQARKEFEDALAAS
ncbi:hypothetical protein [Pseudarthrobacter sp. DSP2-3-2b1]|uniref:hypothetical protein n=1 Tax=Pseudarthrobacter sp. DSP2-3-2b1 TaxID=2804661 RepID=UPI003CF0E344